MLATDYKVELDTAESRFYCTTQTYYTAMVQKYQESGGKVATRAVSSPMAAEDLAANYDDEVPSDVASAAVQKRARSFVGTAMYPAGNSCPDLMQCATYLARRIQKWVGREERTLARLMSWCDQNTVASLHH